MAKRHLRLVTPATVNRTVAPRRRPNADLRTREYINAGAKIHRLAREKIHQQCWQKGPEFGIFRQASGLGEMIRWRVRAGTA